MVVVRTPMLDRRLSILEAGKPVQIEAVLSELAVEALDKRVLSRLSWLDEVQLHPLVLGPEEHRLAGELRTVVANDSFRQCPAELIKFASEPMS